MNELMKMESAPEHLANVEPEGLEELKKHLIPSSLRIVQKMSSDLLLNKFNVGQIVLLPEELAVADHEDSATFIPIFFYNEFITWNPRVLAKTEGAILERSFDPNSEIAKKAKDPDKREEAHPTVPDELVKHLEHLNYMVVLQHEFAPPAPCVISFSSTGHFVGRKMSNLIVARNKPIYAGKYSLMTAKQSNAEGEWYQFSVENQGWCNEEEFEICKQLHEDIKEKQIVADYDN